MELVNEQIVDVDDDIDQELLILSEFIGGLGYFDLQTDQHVVDHFC